MQTPTGRQQPTHPGNQGATLVGDPGIAAYAEPRAEPPHPAEPRAEPLHPADTVAVPGDPDPEAPSGPIFVDASGRRRKLARRASLAAVAVLAGYAALLAVSFAGGPIPPRALLPVPGIPSGRQQAPASSAPANPASSTKPGDHAAAARPTAGTSDHLFETRATTTAGAPGQSAPSEPRPTSSAATTPSGTVAPPPTPTGTSAASTPTSTRGNPTPPGHTRRQSPSPSLT